MTYPDLEEAPAVSRCIDFVAASYKRELWSLTDTKSI